MATINYNVMQLEEVTTPQIFDPPREMLVWDSDRTPFTNDIPNLNKRKVIAILPKVFANDIVLTINHENKYIPYTHCAEIPDPPKPRRATNRELSRWLAEGKGEFTNPEPKFYSNYSSFAYEECDKDKEVYASFKVRKWDDTDWHEPTADYMFGGDDAEV